MEQEVEVKTDNQYYKYIVCLSVKAEGRDGNPWPLQCTEFRLVVVNVLKCRIAERLVVKVNKFADAITQIDDFLEARKLLFPQVVFLTKSRWQLDTCIKWEAACKEVNLQHSHWCFHLDARVECLKADLGSKLSHTINKLSITDSSPEDILAKITISLLQRGHHFKSPQSASNTLLSTIQNQWLFGGNETDEIGQAILERSAVVLTGIPRKGRSDVTAAAAAKFALPIEVSVDYIIVDPNPEAASVQVYFVLPDSESWQLLLTYYNRDFAGNSDIDILPVTIKEVEDHGWRQPPPAPLGPPASLSLYPSTLPIHSMSYAGCDSYDCSHFDYYGSSMGSQSHTPYHPHGPVDELSNNVVVLRYLFCYF